MSFLLRRLSVRGQAEAWAHRTAIVALLAGAALAMTACRTVPSTPDASSPTTGQTVTSSPSVTASATPSPMAANRQASVYGTLSVRIAETTKDSAVPRAPIRYTLVAKPTSGGAETLHPVDANGDFALVLPPGTYELPALEIQAADVAPQPFRMPLTSTEKLRFTAPASGCIYGGHLELLYGRLPAGTMDQQTEVLGQVADSTGTNQIMFAFVPTGGFVITGGKLSIPPAAARPTAARACTANEFDSVPL